MTSHLALALALATTAHADIPPGTTIEPAVVVDFTPQGLNSLSSLAQSLIPDTLAIPTIYETDGLYSQDCTPLIGWPCWDITIWEYILEISGFDVGVILNQFEIVPIDGALMLDIGVGLTVSSSSDPGIIYASATGLGLEISQTCDVWLEPTPLDARTRIDIALIGSSVDVAIQPIDIGLDFSGIRVDGCLIEAVLDVIGFFDSIIGFFGGDIWELISDLAEPLVEAQINGLLPELETTLEDALGALQLSSELPIGDVTLELDVAPSVIEITPDGLRVGLAGAVDPGPTPAPCISRYVMDGSPETGFGPPPLGDGADIYAHDMGLFVDDDFVNQLVYSAWYGGLLCFELSEGEDAGFDIPIPLNTSLLGLLAAGEYDELFPSESASPLIMATRPELAPEATMDGPNDVDIEVDRLGLDMYGSLDGRFARVAGFDISADAGLNLSFDGTTGDLAVDVVFEPSSDLDIIVAFNDIKPSSSNALEDGITGIVDTVVGPLLGGLTDSLAFALPSIQGLGLESMAIDGAGPAGDFLGLYADIGLVPYNNELDTASGCNSGCADTGCASGGHPGPALAWFLPLAALLARRRRA
jgi:hypothetical protein